VTGGRQDARIMPVEPGRSTAVLIVRLWRDAGDGTAFRARVLHSQDVEREPQEVELARDPDELLTIVRAWLDQFLRA
jgi:hypothetical protein